MLLTILDFVTDGCTYGGTTGGSIYEDFAPLTQINLGTY